MKPAHIYDVYVYYVTPIDIFLRNINNCIHLFDTLFFSNVFRCFVVLSIVLRAVNRRKEKF